MAKCISLSKAACTREDSELEPPRALPSSIQNEVAVDNSRSRSPVGLGRPAILSNGNSSG